jgi:hypothetical protein
MLTVPLGGMLSVRINHSGYTLSIEEFTVVKELTDSSRGEFGFTGV